MCELVSRDGSVVCYRRDGDGCERCVALLDGARGTPAWAARPGGPVSVVTRRPSEALVQAAARAAILGPVRLVLVVDGCSVGVMTHMVSAAVTRARDAKVPNEVSVHLAIYPDKSYAGDAVAVVLRGNVFARRFGARELAVVCSWTPEAWDAAPARERDWVPVASAASASVAAEAAEVNAAMGLARLLFRGSREDLDRFEPHYFAASAGHMLVVRGPDADELPPADVVRLAAGRAIDAGLHFCVDKDGAMQAWTPVFVAGATKDACVAFTVGTVRDGQLVRATYTEFVDVEEMGEVVRC